MNNYKVQESVRNDLLDEAVEEEIIELLTSVIVETDSSGSSVADVSKRSKAKGVAAKQYADVLLDETVREEILSTCEGCFDNFISNHKNNVDAIHELNSILQDVTREMICDICYEVVEGKSYKIHQEMLLETIIQEVIEEESVTVADKTLNHYRTRVALQQYKQMQESASDSIIDSIFLDALLSEYDTKTPSDNPTAFDATESSKILDKVILEILLSQSIALHSCFPRNKSDNLNKTTLSSEPMRECIPLKWYKKKMTSAIAEDVVVSLLSDRLDESIQFAADEQIKDQAISLFHRYFDTA